MPRQLLVTEKPKSWDLAMPGVEVVAARDYLTSPEYAGIKRASVFNLCRSYAYQSVGYYVSLLASARGHKPLPSVTTLVDLRIAPILRVVADDLDDQIQRALKGIKADEFTLSIYFGRNMAQRYDRLCDALFSHLPAPFLRAEFRRHDRWELEGVRPIGAGAVPANHREFVAERAQKYFARPRIKRKAEFRWDLAILRDPEEVDAPSDDRALRHFARAAQDQGLRCDEIDRRQLARIAEYDALFIRETTAVDHHTYRFARRAEAEGLVVIDDPTSIIRCTNKVFLAEVFARNDIPCPRTMTVHRDNIAAVADQLGFPCVLKRPDSSFSAGVVKVSSPEELEAQMRTFLEDSELVLAQSFTPSDFDWRIGVLDGRALFACKYYMVPGHWQIQRNYASRRRRYGKVDTMPLSQAPADAVALAERASALIGTGFYGVDIKPAGDGFAVMEINDNPNLEGGVEDGALGDELYRRIAAFFVDRLQRRGKPGEMA